ncbi:MAG TPA: COX15/CtaA family protein [Alphaproteobacteria bacterium]|nr:COX15/CtaA family protein [Alphaproteobacteria bacterium]
MAPIDFVRTSAGEPSATRDIGYWLLCCCGLVFAMVVIGGITRLTLSGLSITEWNPVMGTIPPLNAADWQSQFDLYRQTPQYKILNAGMTLAEFKSIFWWEYIHRLLGRAIGIAFFLPFVYFAARGRVDRKLAWRLAAILALGAMQGALGWFMVRSGLVERTSVSPYRLAAHLALALIIYACMFWLALDHLWPKSPAQSETRTGHDPRGKKAARRALRLVAWIFFVMLSGAFVAGLHAGLVYNTFPLMDGRLIPDGLFDRSPALANFFENATTAQFNHRILAFVSLAIIIAFWISLWRRALPPRARLAANLLLFAVVLQITLGIATLLLVVPVPLAAAHQAGALTLFTLALWLAHETSRTGS